MTATTMLDLRRSDLRTNVLENPYWLTSAEVGISADDTAAVMFSFSSAVYTRGVILIHAICMQVTTLWAGGTITLDIGTGTIPLESTTTAGTVTVTDEDDYIDNTEVTHGTVGYYFPAATDYLTGIAAQTWPAVCKIVPAASTVPCVVVFPVSNSTMTGGASRIHMLISELPGY